MSTSAVGPGSARVVMAAGIDTVVHDAGAGDPVLLLHGSGPGVTAWANWRLTIPALAHRFRVVAPDVVGFGDTRRPPGVTYDLDTWTAHAVGVLDALGIESAHVVGNSFGGALALSLAVRHPDRVRRLALMGAVGVRFDITPGLDAVWGYEPSVEAMRGLLDLFAYDRDLVSDDLAQLRYEASIRPGIQEAYAAMFPAPRQRWVDAMTVDEDLVAAIPHETLVVHGRDDLIIPMSNSLRLLELIDRSQLHVFGRCGHWTQIEHAERFNRLVGDFFSEP
ncbi:MAG: alpha/beta fold hydrolase [Candidatus Nanopelagicales bacterium]